MNKNILFCGVGGQGTVLASKLIAAAAMSKKIPVTSAETIGMAQKGGSVFSFLRMGEDLFCPMLPRGSADILIAFEPAEAVRMLPYLKKNGLVVVNSCPIMPVTAVLTGLSYNGEEMIEYIKKQVRSPIIIDGAAACAEIGSQKALNMVLLGAAVASGVLELSIEDIKQEMKLRVKPQFFDMNCRALEYLSGKDKQE